MPDESTANGENPAAAGETPVLDFDQWIAGQTEDVRGLLDRHTTGLRTALETERQQRKDFAKQLRDATVAVEKGSAAEKALAELSGKLETESKRADFYEQATAAGCRNLRLAWLAASADGLTLKEVQAQHPDLFSVARPPATQAGNGTQRPTGGGDINAWMRRAAGHRG